MVINNSLHPLEAMLSPELQPSPALETPRANAGHYVKNVLSIGMTGLALVSAGIVAKDVIAPTPAAAVEKCTTTTEGNTTTTTCVDEGNSPSGESVPPPDAEEPTPTPVVPAPEQEEDKQDTKDRKNHRVDKTYDLLSLPPKRKATRYWATMILNETRKGKDGRISSSIEARKNLYQARQGKCSPVEQIPGRCEKVDGTLLKVLYRASKEQKFYIWHLTGGPHVPNSHHFDGDATDLRRFDGSAPKTKALFPILSRATPRNKRTEMLGPGDNAAHTGPINGHIHYAVF